MKQFFVICYEFSNLASQAISYGVPLPVGAAPKISPHPYATTTTTTHTSSACLPLSEYPSIHLQTLLVTSDPDPSKGIVFVEKKNRINNR